VSTAQDKPAGGWAIARIQAGTLLGGMAWPPTAAKGQMPPLTPTQGRSASACSHTAKAPITLGLNLRATALYFAHGNTLKIL